MQMSQGEVIVLAVVVAFVAFLALKGKLGRYWSLLLGGTTGASSASAAQAGGGIAGGIAGPGLGSIAAPGGVASIINNTITQAGSTGLPNPAAPTDNSPLAGNPVAGTVTSGNVATGAVWQYLPNLPALPPVSF